MNLPQKLIESYTRGSFGVYVGAGISQGSGLPSWDSLLVELIDHAVELAAISAEKKEELLGLIGQHKFLLVAEELKEILANDLYQFIQKRFDNDDFQPTDTLLDIIKLKSKFIVTTNYDTLIEKAFVLQGKVPNDLTYKDAATINDSYVNGKTFILKAHGDARRAPNEIILTQKDYRNIIYRERGYQGVLQTLFSTCNVLFLGASLRDPELELMLGYIHNFFHGGSPDHFALMNQEDITPTEQNRWRKDFNINIVPYNPKDNHSEVGEFVKLLLNT